MEVASRRNDATFVDNGLENLETVKVHSSPYKNVLFIIIHFTASSCNPRLMPFSRWRTGGGGASAAPGAEENHDIPLHTAEVTYAVSYDSDPTTRVRPSDHSGATGRRWGHSGSCLWHLLGRR